MINQAIILSAGLGTRLRPLTDSCPKPMLNIGNKPAIAYHLEALAKAGIQSVVIHVSYLADMITEYIQDGSKWGLKVKYSYTDKLLGTGGGIKLSVNELEEPEQPFICVNADIYTGYDFKTLINFDQYIDGKKWWGYLLMVANPNENSKGDYDLVRIKLEQIFRGISKDLLANHKTHACTFSGIAVYHPDMFLRYENFEDFAITHIINNNQHRFVANVYNGMWYDIGCIHNYEYINREVIGHDEC